MRAILCKELGPANTLVIDDIPSPEPGKGQVKVRVKAAGLNFPDTLIIEGKYQIKPELPFSPGGEMAGEVIAVLDIDSDQPAAFSQQDADQLAAILTQVFGGAGPAGPRTRSASKGVRAHTVK